MSNNSLKTIRGRLAAARGDAEVDCLLAGGRMIDVFSGKIVNQAVALHDGIIVGFGDYRAKTVVDLHGEYLAPGFIESHIHIESSCLTPQNFAAAAIQFGTTTVIADPHEIANVMGIDGINLMLKWGKDAPLDFYFMLPSCVPATSMETAGAALNAEDMKPLLEHPDILGIAEMMNFPGTIFGEPKVIAKLSIEGKGKRIDGHAPGLTGKNLSAYCLAGPKTDHECTTKEEALEKLSRGMVIMIREGSTAKNLRELIPLVNNTNERRFVLVSDDRSAKDLVEFGHLDHTVRKATRLGLDPLIAIRMVTINPAETFGLTNKGAIAPGYDADLITFKSLENIEISNVWKSGVLIPQESKLSFLPAMSMKIKPKPLSIKPLKSNEFDIAANGDMVKVINIIPGQIVTKKSIEKPLISEGLAVADTKRDILKLAVIERYTGDGNKSFGFVCGFGIRDGAIASTVAHDSHNLIVCGDNDVSMMIAANHLINIGGGMVAVKGENMIADLPLPIAGLMSPLRANEVAEAESTLHKAGKQIGINIPDPFMLLTFLALPVIPELKLTDQGLVDVHEFNFTSLFQ